MDFVLTNVRLSTFQHLLTELKHVDYVTKTVVFVREMPTTVLNVFFPLFWIEINVNNHVYRSNLISMENVLTVYLHVKPVQLKQIVYHVCLVTCFRGSVLLSVLMVTMLLKIIKFVNSVILLV